MHRTNRLEDRRAGVRHLGRRLFVAMIFATLIATTPIAASAGSGRAVAAEAGVGFSAGLLSLMYAPLKIVYAGGGLVVGGLAYAFSGGDAEVAMVVITPATAGEYVVTTDHLRERRMPEFFGRDPSYRPDEASTAEIAGLPSGW